MRVICLADERYGQLAQLARIRTQDGREKGRFRKMNRQLGVESVVSGKYDRVIVSTNFRQQLSSTGNKSKKEAKDSV